MRSNVEASFKMNSFKTVSKQIVISVRIQHNKDHELKTKHRRYFHFNKQNVITTLAESSNYRRSGGDDITSSQMKLGCDCVCVLVSDLDVSDRTSLDKY